MINRRDIWPLSKGEAMKYGFTVNQWYRIAKRHGLPAETTTVSLSQIIRTDRESRTIPKINVPNRGMIDAYKVIITENGAYLVSYQVLGETLATTENKKRK